MITEKLLVGLNHVEDMLYNFVYIARRGSVFDLRYKFDKPIKVADFKNIYGELGTLWMKHRDKKVCMSDDIHWVSIARRLKEAFQGNLDLARQINKTAIPNIKERDLLIWMNKNER